MSRSYIFIILIISFLAGILIAQKVLEKEVSKSMTLVFLWVLTVRKLIDSLAKQKSGCFKIYIFALIFLLFGYGRFISSLDVEGNHVSNYFGEVEIEGCIFDEVDVRKDKIKYVLNVFSVFLNGQSQNVSGKVLVIADRYPVYNYGDCLRIFGVQKSIDDFYNSSYEEYLSRYYIYSIIDHAQIEKISENNGNIFFSLIYKFKNSVKGKLNKIFTEPYNSLMAGLLLGSRNEISKELMEKFKDVGLTHILAISGYNVALVIFIVGGFLGFLSRKVKVLFLIFFIFVFVILTGASASVVRAALMGCISLIALFYGRNYFMFLSLFVSAFFMNLWNPKILVYDVSFQLSFLATFGIGVFSPLIEKYFKWVPDFFSIRESIKMTISAQVFAIPIIVLNFGNLSLVSPIANVFVLPLIPFVTIIGVLAVFFSYISAFLGNVFGFFGYLLINLMIFFVDVFSSFPLSSISLSFGFWIIIFYYALLVKIVFKAFFMEP